MKHNIEFYTEVVNPVNYKFGKRLFKLKDKSGLSFFKRIQFKSKYWNPSHNRLRRSSVWAKCGLTNKKHATGIYAKRYLSPGHLFKSSISISAVKVRINKKRKNLLMSFSENINAALITNKLCEVNKKTFIRKENYFSYYPASKGTYKEFFRLNQEFIRFKWKKKEKKGIFLSWWFNSSVNFCFLLFINQFLNRMFSNVMRALPLSVNMTVNKLLTIPNAIDNVIYSVVSEFLFSLVESWKKKTNSLFFSYTGKPHKSKKSIINFTKFQNNISLQLLQKKKHSGVFKTKIAWPDAKPKSSIFFLEMSAQSSGLAQMCRIILPLNQKKLAKFVRDYSISNRARQILSDQFLDFKDYRRLARSMKDVVNINRFNHPWFIRANNSITYSLWRVCFIKFTSMSSWWLKKTANYKQQTIYWLGEFSSLAYSTNKALLPYRPYSSDKYRMYIWQNIKEKKESFYLWNALKDSWWVKHKESSAGRKHLVKCNRLLLVTVRRKLIRWIDRKHKSVRKRFYTNNNWKEQALYGNYLKRSNNIRIKMIYKVPVYKRHSFYILKNIIRYKSTKKLIFRIISEKKSLFNNVLSKQLSALTVFLNKKIYKKKRCKKASIRLITMNFKRFNKNNMFKARFIAKYNEVNFRIDAVALLSSQLNDAFQLKPLLPSQGAKIVMSGLYRHF